VLRKRYFNQMEDMKGKIRVYARTRPLSSKDIREEASFALTFPDEFTLEHPWKEEKKPRSYQFDSCFNGNTTQEEIFEDTKYLVQSAVDGYNVCIFAYGQVRCFCLLPDTQWLAVVHPHAGMRMLMLPPRVRMEVSSIRKGWHASHTPVGCAAVQLARCVLHRSSEDHMSKSGFTWCQPLRGRWKRSLR
jgi:hypothetical protein